MDPYIVGGIVLVAVCGVLLLAWVWWLATRGARIRRRFEDGAHRLLPLMGIAHRWPGDDQWSDEDTVYDRSETGPRDMNRAPVYAEIPRGTAPVETSVLGATEQ